MKYTLNWHKENMQASIDKYWTLKYASLPTFKCKALDELERASLKDKEEEQA